MSASISVHRLDASASITVLSYASAVKFRCHLRASMVLHGATSLEKIYNLYNCLCMVPSQSRMLDWRRVSDTTANMSSNCGYFRLGRSGYKLVVISTAPDVYYSLHASPILGLDLIMENDPSIHVNYVSPPELPHYPCALAAT